MRITLSGLPGAGKGTIRKKLEEKYNLESCSVGDIRREYAINQGISIQELNERGEKDPTSDINADAYQKKWAENKRNGFILEGRLPYYFFPESIRVFLTVDQKIGAKRILQAERKTEKKVLGLEEQIKINEGRCESDIKRYKEIYGIPNCYDENQFDIIIDTTKRTPNQVMKILQEKIRDYNQKMNPPTFYFGHPTRAKDDQELQERFKKLEENIQIKFFNPFKDNPAEKIDSKGEVDYKKMSQEHKENIAEGDLLAVLDKKIIGGIFVYNGDFTVGTQMESLIGFCAGKLNYIVTPSGEKEFLYHHPFFRRIKTEIFPNLDTLENYLTEKRNNLYIEVRKVREAWKDDPIAQRLFEEMVLNKKYLGR